MTLNRFYLQYRIIILEDDLYVPWITKTILRRAIEMQFSLNN